MPPSRPDHPDHKTVRDHLKAVKAKGKLFAWKYVEMREDGQPASVRCKLCGRVIYGRRPTGDPVIVAQSSDKSRTILQVETELGPLPGYRQFLITHDDGTAHATPLCQTCGATAPDAETLEALELADHEQTAAELAASGPDGEAQSRAYLARHAHPEKRYLALVPFDPMKGR